MKKVVFRWKRGDIIDGDSEVAILSSIPSRRFNSDGSDDLDDREVLTQNVEIIIKNWREKTKEAQTKV